MITIGDYLSGDFIKGRKRKMPDKMSAIPAWTWIVGAVLVIAIIFFAGFRAVQTQRHLHLVQNQLASTMSEAAQANAQIADLKKQTVSLNAELDKANAQRDD